MAVSYQTLASDGHNANPKSAPFPRREVRDRGPVQCQSSDQQDSDCRPETSTADPDWRTQTPRLDAGANEADQIAECIRYAQPQIRQSAVGRNHSELDRGGAATTDQMR